MDDVYQRLLTLERAVRSLQAQNASLLTRIAADETRQNVSALGRGPQPSSGGGMAGWGTISTTIAGGASGNVTVTSGPLNTQVVSMKNNYTNSITVSSGTKIVWWWLDTNDGTFYVVTADC